jgi:hypothetical protein
MDRNCIIISYFREENGLLDRVAANPASEVEITVNPKRHLRAVLESA